jgi:hypothetical protein
LLDRRISCNVEAMGVVAGGLFAALRDDAERL